MGHAVVISSNGDVQQAFGYDLVVLTSHALITVYRDYKEKFT
jgi:hypothetical protein